MWFLRGIWLRNAWKNTNSKPPESWWAGTKKKPRLDIGTFLLCILVRKNNDDTENWYAIPQIIWFQYLRRYVCSSVMMWCRAPVVLVTW